MKKQTEVTVESGKFIKDSSGVLRFVKGKSPKAKAAKKAKNTVSLDDDCNESCYENSYEGE
jgi:hypothetical protein